MGRFINADDTDYLGADGTLFGYNLFTFCRNNPVIGFDPTGHWDWGGVVAGLAILAVGTAAFVLTITTAGTLAPAIALAVSSLGTIASAATIATGVVVTRGAATDGTIVSDFTCCVGGERKGISIGTDFKNDTCEIYTHPGAGTSDAMGISYATGYVYGYEGLGDYSGDFAEGGVSALGYGISYSQDPGKGFNTGCRAVCFGFSSPGAFSIGASYDYFISVGHFIF